MKMRTVVAKRVLEASGLLSRVKTWQRVYEMSATAPGGFRMVGRRWISCTASVQLMELSMRIDPRHWDHWALIHEDCAGELCPDCDGHMDADA